jgi:hypothetical protein
LKVNYPPYQFDTAKNKGYLIRPRKVVGKMKKRTTIYLDEDLHKKVRMLAIKENTTMAKIFVQALRRYLAEIEEDPRQEKFAQILGKAQ